MAEGPSAQGRLKLQLPTFLYRLYDADAVLLYVGITDNVKTRMKQHAKAQPWWPRVADVTVEMCASREAAEAAELTAIRAERPTLNVVGVVRELAPPPLASCAPRGPQARRHAWRE